MFTFLINFAQMANVFGEVSGVLGTTAAIADIFLYEPKIKSSYGDKVSESSINDGSLTLNDIEFSYPTKESIKVIQKANIIVEKNKTVALVGTSGCGKSTII